MDHLESSELIRLVIHGATGRMGQSLALNAAKADDIEIVAGIAASKQSVKQGLSAHWPQAECVETLEHVQAAYDAVIDFSTPDGAESIARACAEAEKPLVSGTTGLTRDQMDVLHVAANRVAVLHAPNMSQGINLLIDLAHRAASALGDGTDVEIVDIHHRYKKDAPSGTALALGRAVSAAWDADLDARAVYDRRDAERQPGSIGFQSLRAGDIVGEHQLVFALDGERVELVHRATNRNIFALGALRAARWIVRQGPGFYSMRDVLIA